MKKIFFLLPLLLILVGCANNKRLDQLENRLYQNEQRTQRVESVVHQTGTVAVQNSERLDKIYKSGSGETRDSGYLVVAIEHISRISADVNDLRSKVNQSTWQPSESMMDARIEKLLEYTRENRDLIDHGKEVVSFPVFFRTGSYVVKESLHWLAEENIDLENATIVGYADKMGDEERNKEISLKRAEAVRDALQRLGVETRNIKVEAFGETERYGFGINGNNRRAVVYAQKNPTQ